MDTAALSLQQIDDKVERTLHELEPLGIVGLKTLDSNLLAKRVLSLLYSWRMQIDPR